jgi:membrane-bound lytic murein transglycosylase B
MPAAGMVAALALATAAGAAAPPPKSPIPRDPSQLARTLVATKQDLNDGIDSWIRAEGARRNPPDAVTLNALFEQRVELVLVQKPPLARATLRQLPPTLAAEVETNLRAKDDLWRLTPVTRRRRFRTGAALPASTLLRHYRAAERRFGVGWNVLAAVNFVESAFNKLRNNSAAGAQGPMQFVPATWRAYGLGGNVHDPHDAIMGAANYLHANGAPKNNRRALYRYNPSPLYVDAVLRYARRVRADTRAFYTYYARQVFVRTQRGLRRLTGPGLG